MNDQMQTGMAEAMRLIGEGQVAEATAVIQRALGGGAPVASPAAPGADGPIEASAPVVDRATRITAPTAPTQPGPTEGPGGHTLRRAPRPPRPFRGEPLPFDGLPGTMPGFMPGPTVGAPAPDVVPEGGQFVERSYTNQAGTRSYKLYIPSGYVGQEVPLVVVLHGCTQGPDDIAAGTRMNELAEEHTFLVAYPAQAAGANMNKCWNWFEAADQRRGRGEPSLIAGITCEVLSEYHVATDRVYVAGMSAGGAMAAILGETYPDLYAAIGVHSGLAPGAARDLPSAFAAMRGGSPGEPADGTGEPARPVPAIVFHGDRDSTVHPRNAEHLLARYRVAAETAGASGAVRVTVRRGQVPDGYAYTRATHRDAGGRAVAEHWTVHELGHAWSGGSRSGSYTDAGGPDASAEMLRFFRQHPRPEAVIGEPCDR
jgi:poly(hydroxyalkanoate) depolymerase family esterase